MRSQKRFEILLSMVLVGCASRFEIDEGGASGAVSTSTGTDATTTEVAETGTPTTEHEGTASSTTTGSTSEGTSSEPYRGNGIVEDGEECDEGDPEGMCTGCEHCRVRRTAYFDGETAFIEVDGDALELVDTPFTIEAWMRVDGADEHVRVSRMINRAPGGYWLRLNTENVFARMHDGTANVQAPPPGLGWYHVAWTYGGNASRVFVDGTLVGQEPLSPSLMPADDIFRIGMLASAHGDVMERGRIDEVRISSIVRYSPAGFSPVRRFEPDADTLLLLHLDGEAADESPLGHGVSAVDVVWEPDDGYGREAFCEGADR
jgi:hypothetical protein